MNIQQSLRTPLQTGLKTGIFSYKYYTATPLILVRKKFLKKLTGFIRGVKLFMAAAAASVPDALPEQEDSKMIERNEQENGGRGDLNFELFNTAEGEEDPSRLIDPALVTEIPVANAQENGQVAQAA